jgi:hypothetical protein
MVRQPRCPSDGKSEGGEDSHKHMDSTIDHKIRQQSATNDSEEPVSILPSTAQEGDIDNLDLEGRYNAFGHMDFNAATGSDLGRLLEGGALETAVQDIIEDEDENVNNPVTISHGTGSSTQFSHSTLTINPTYDPKYHYPPDLLAKLFRGGFKDDGTLDARFAAYRELQAIPSSKSIPKTSFSTTCYNGEEPTEDCCCPRSECGQDLK